MVNVYLRVTLVMKSIRFKNKHITHNPARPNHGPMRHEGVLVSSISRCCKLQHSLEVLNMVVLHMDPQFIFGCQLLITQMTLVFLQLVIVNLNIFNISLLSTSCSSTILWIGRPRKEDFYSSFCPSS